MKREILTQLPEKFRKARLEQGITQAKLAEIAGCKQSAISMLEGGKLDALADSAIEKIAEHLGIELSALEPKPAITLPIKASVIAEVAMCPNFLCPSNKPYIVGGSVFFMPTGKAGNITRCAICGEILIKECPHCGAKLVKAGGCCCYCGKPLVEFPEGYTDDILTWVERASYAAQQL